MSVTQRAACLGLVLGAGLFVAAYAPAGDIVRSKTFFNLADSVRGYLSLDAETGTPEVAASSGIEESGTFWELRAIGRHRGYRVHMLVNRGNNRFNDMFLAVDEQTGELTMSDDRDAEETKWLVRYAGYFQGYDAYYVQLLGETAGGYDLSFLSVDENGKVVLQRDPSDAIHWRMRPTPSLPSQVIR